MFRRLKRAEFEKQKGEGNKKAMRAIVDSETVPGLLAYSREEPIAWCSVGPREHYPGLERSRILQPIDDKSVWSVVCFFVKREYRKKGLTVKFLHAAIDYVRQNGGKIIEAYPIQPKKETMPSVFAWPGLASAFKQVNFIECIRRSETRPIMRYYIEETKSKGTIR
jgi:GNAT superfamily N-acetyltransferase